MGSPIRRKVTRKILKRGTFGIGDRGIWEHPDVRGLSQATPARSLGLPALRERGVGFGRAPSTTRTGRLDLPLCFLRPKGDSHQSLCPRVQGAGARPKRIASFLTTLYRTGFLIAPALY